MTTLIIIAFIALCSGLIFLLAIRGAKISYQEEIAYLDNFIRVMPVTVQNYSFIIERFSDISFHNQDPEFTLKVWDSFREKYREEVIKLVIAPDYVYDHFINLQTRLMTFDRIKLSRNIDKSLKNNTFEK